MNYKEKPKPVAATTKPDGRQALQEAIQSEFQKVIDQIATGPALGTSILLLNNLKESLLKKVKEQDGGFKK